MSGGAQSGGIHLRALRDAVFQVVKQIDIL
jgi:hypothetical protein